MGWWATGHDDDIAGDDPVDTIVEDLAFYHEMHGDKPSFQELLDAFAATLQLYGGALLADPDSYVNEPMEAVFAPPAPTLVTSANLGELACDPSSPVSSLILNLFSAFRKISKQYLESEVQRKPRVTEMVEVLAFPLRVRPERLLRDAAGLELQEFRVRR